MADCPLVRCSQEKRFIRKEFHRWSRNILLVVGFERIAEELMGKRNFKTILFPQELTEEPEPCDWVQDDVCYFCQSKKSPPLDPASGVFPIKNDYVSLPNDLDEDSSDQTGSRIENPLGADLSKDQPLDLSLYSTRKPDQVANFCNGNGGGPSDDGEGSDSGISGSNSYIKVPHVPVKSGSKRRFDPNGKKSYTEEELKAALRDIQSGKLGTRRAAVIYGIPRSTLRNKVYKMASVKREQLQRHQHSKLKKDEEKSGHLQEEALDADENTDKNTLCGVSASESLRRLLKQTITSKRQKDVTGTNSLEDNESVCPDKGDDEVNEGDIVLPWPLTGNRNTVDAFNSLTTTDFNQSISPILTQVLANIQHLALANGAADANDLRDIVAEEVRDSCSDSFPLLPELIRRLAEERFEIERDKLIKQQLEEDFIDNNPIEDDQMPESHKEIGCSNVILKIPSYKPTKSCSIGTKIETGLQTPTTKTMTLPPPYSPRPSNTVESVDAQTSSQNSSGNNNQKGITVSLKELIARSINQRLGTNVSGTDESLVQDLDKVVPNEKWRCLAENIADNFEPKNVLGTSKLESLNDTSSPSSISITSVNDCAANQHHKGEKRRRPKRGRYRNYDTDNLAQAVRAVQKGEMSVHRAGTFFGVPHSTLEYKVKERHLLRPKKRDARKVSSKSCKNNLQRTNYQKTYYLRAGKSGTTEPVTAPSLSGLSPNGLSSSQPDDDELEEDENREKKHVKGSLISHETSQTNRYSNAANLAAPNPLTLWQNAPFFPVDLGLAHVTSNGFFASQMMKKLQENVRLQEESLKRSEKEKCSGRVVEATLMEGNMGILESLIKSTLEKSLPRLAENVGAKSVSNGALETQTLALGDSTLNAKKV